MSQQKASESTQELFGSQLKKVPLTLNNNHTVQWLRRRFAHQSKIQYLNRPQELKKQIDIQNVFKKFDEDGSNSLEIGEVYQMFQQNGIDINEATLKKLFSIVDTRNTGALDLDGFKEFTMSEEANDRFRKIIKLLRRREEEKTSNERVPFLPFDFNSLLNYLSQKTQREKLLNKINSTHFNVDETVVDVRAFNQLFKMVAEDNNENLDQPIKKQVKLRYEIDRMKIEKLLQKKLTSIYAKSPNTQNNDHTLLNDQEQYKLKLEAMKNFYQDLHDQTHSSHLNIIKQSQPDQEDFTTALKERREYRRQNSQSSQVHLIFKKQSQQVVDNTITEQKHDDDSAFSDDIVQSDWLNKIDKLYQQSTQASRSQYLNKEFKSIIDPKKERQRQDLKHRRSMSQNQVGIVHQSNTQREDHHLNEENIIVGSSTRNQINTLSSQASIQRKLNTQRIRQDGIHAQKFNYSQEKKTFLEAKRFFNYDKALESQSTFNFDNFRRRDFIFEKSVKLERQKFENQMRQERMGIQSNLKGSPNSRNKSIAQTHFRPVTTISNERMATQSQTQNPIEMRQMLSARVINTQNTHRPISIQDSRLIETARQIQDSIYSYGHNNLSSERIWKQTELSSYDYKSNPHSLERLRKYKANKPFAQILESKQNNEQRMAKSSNKRLIKDIIKRRKNIMMVSPAQQLIRNLEKPDEGQILKYRNIML